MKKILVSLLVIGGLMLASAADKPAKKAKDFRMVPADQATIVQTGENKTYCPICGMTLPMFYKTNHAATHKGHNSQYCSIVCLVEDAIVNNKKLDNHRVVDNSTLKFIDSKDAFFVVGSKKPGTMSVVSKYAFGTKEAADEFAKANGGDVMKFDALYALVEKSQAKDMKATKMKQAKAAKKGEMMYNKMCKKTDKKFASTADAKTFLVKSKICGNIKGKKLQAIGIYLGRQ